MLKNGQHLTIQAEVEDDGQFEPGQILTPFAGETGENEQNRAEHSGREASRSIEEQDEQIQPSLVSTGGAGMDVDISQVGKFKSKYITSIEKFNIHFLLAVLLLTLSLIL